MDAKAIETHYVKQYTIQYFNLSYKRYNLNWDLKMLAILSLSISLIYLGFKILTKILFSNYVSISQTKNYSDCIINTYSKDRWNF